MNTDQNKREQDDIQDSASDVERLKPEVGSIDLPDVKDIPGQEHIHVPPLGDLADVTISSADEEDLLSGDTLADAAEFEDEDKLD